MRRIGATPTIFINLTTRRTKEVHNFCEQLFDNQWPELTHWCR